MPQCATCGEHDGLNNKCNYCGRTHCKAHTLPENHRCVGLRSGGWEKYKEARQKRNADHPRSPVENSDTTSTEDETSAASRKSTPPKKKLDKHGWGSKVKKPPESGSESGDDSPPVELKSDGGASEGEETNEWRGLYSASYAFFHRFGEFIINVFFLALAIVTLFLGFVFSKRGFALLLVLGLGIGAYSAVEGTGIEPVDETVDSVVAGGQSFISGLGNSSESTGEGPHSGQNQPQSAKSGLNTEKIESAIHQAINTRRQKNSLSPLTYDERLETIAQFHSDNMVSEGFFAHDSPSGMSMSDRYDRFNYNCRVETGANTYAAGAENIAYTYAGQDVRTDSGSIINHNFNETSIGRGLVNQWMNSTGHRKNILRRYWQNEGIGVTIKRTSEGVRVYATQNFC